MPLVIVYTSSPAPAADKAQAILKTVSTLTAKAIGKPERYVATRLAPSAHMTFGGSDAPSCVVEIKSIGGLSASVCTELTKAMGRTVHENLGVPTDRTYVVFQDVPAAHWGFDGATFG
jgi:phenylpyruvate tautomerase